MSKFLALTETHEMIAPGNQFAGRIETGLQEVEPRGTIEVMMHVVFARPQQFHGRAVYLFGDVRGFDDVVIGKAPAEASADTRQVHGEIAFGNAGRFSRLFQAALWSLAG